MNVATVLTEGARHLVERLIGGNRLNLVTLLLTYRCNLRCGYCDFPDRAADEMETGQVLDLLGDLRRNGAVRYSLSGGEPLLREDLGVILGRVRELGGLSSVTTNGVLLEERMELLEDVDYLFVTVEGDEAIHDRVRGKGAYERVVAGLVELRRRGRRAGLITPVSRVNMYSLRRSLELAREHGARVYFQPVQPTEAWGGDGALVPGAEEVRGAFRRIRRWKEAGLPVGNSASYLEQVLSAPFGRRGQPCFAGRFVGTILPDGRLVPCCMVAGGRSDWSEPARVGVAGAVSGMERPECGGCSISPYVENSLLLSPDLRAWLELARSDGGRGHAADRA